MTTPHGESVEESIARVSHELFDVDMSHIYPPHNYPGSSSQIPPPNYPQNYQRRDQMLQPNYQQPPK